jgi:8-oxo-dGTP pyrophosphatase MutT (NUDIX family)
MSKTLQMKIIDKLAWIEIKNNKILSTKSFGKDKYYIPGGKRENFETDEQALCREIKEELSVVLIADTLKFIGVFQAQAHGHSEDTIVKMTCYAANYNGLLKADSEIEEMIWLTYSDKDKISEVDKLIFDFLKERNMLE